MSPFRHWVEDGLPVPAYTPPPAGDPLWDVCYDTGYESGKRTTRRIPAALAATVAALAGPEATNRWAARLGYPVLPDPTLWGGGLQVTGPGGRLAVHVDADRHRLLAGWRRAATMILFAHERWVADWGGEVCLCDPNGDVVDKVLPLPGRLVVFENSDLAYHAVAPVTGPAERVTVMIPWLAPAGPRHVRTRALFLPPR